VDESEPTMTIALTTDSARDALRLRELRRTRAAATGLLVACLLVLVGARYVERYHPGFAFLAAFAEAAAIGGLADWYAVVALFRRPLGLPIPHTAIVPRNQARIADSLGEFIERHFLADQPIATKLREVDFAAMIADWLADRRQSDDLARFVLRLLPQALTAMEGSGLRGFLAKRVVERLETVEIAPLAAGLLDAVTHDRRHQRILDELLVALAQLLNNAEALDAIRDKIRQELPTLFRLFQAEGYVLRKLVTSVSSFLDEVRADDAHAVRGEFDRFIAAFIDKLRTSPDYAARLDGLRKDLLARPEVRDLAEGIWESVRGFIEQETQSPSSVVRGALADLLVEVGGKLREDASIRADINEGMVTVLRAFVANQKNGISRFVADQVKSWQVDRLIHMIELNVGRDLQYIRFNGALIGGLAGLALHTAEVLLKLA
jgi:uncharacterized membrane-anchored protein YjiN (DUF445 family)